MKSITLFVLALLLGGCPFLPPSMFQHVDYGVYPKTTISLPIGKRMSDPKNFNVPGFHDIVGVESELNGETLSATFYLRDLPDGVKKNQNLGHMQDFQAQWKVMINIEGDNHTLIEWADYILDATYYKPIGSRVNQGKRLPDYPWIMPTMEKCEVAISESSGDEYNSCPVSEESPEIFLSSENKSITLVATVPGITESSTISFWVWGLVDEQDIDIVPRH